MLRFAQHDEANSNTEQDKFRRAQHDEVMLNTGWGNETYTFSVIGEKFTEKCNFRVVLLHLLKSISTWMESYVGSPKISD